MTDEAFKKLSKVYIDGGIKYCPCFACKISKQTVMSYLDNAIINGKEPCENLNTFLDFQALQETQDFEKN